MRQQSHESSGAAVAARTPDPVVETQHGRLRGVTGPDGIHSFRGVPYGDTTAGANRFMPPQPVRPWSGVRDATVNGPSAPQRLVRYHAPFRWYQNHERTDEDCLVLNVFTPGLDGAKRPVMLWVHGGGYTNGAGTAPGYEGNHLARHGDVVVVSVNHRLHALGFLALAEVMDDPPPANPGLLDLVAALAWVRDNIAQFGGDRDNVTLFGQSGGGAKITMLLAMPAAGLFHKIIVQSSSVLRANDLDLATRLTAAILRRLGLGPRDLRGLQATPVDDLLHAAARAGKELGGGDPFRPIVDGDSLPRHPFDPDAPALSRDIPILTGSTATETTFYLLNDMQNFDLSAEQVRNRVAKILETGPAEADRLLDLYRATRPEHTPSDLMIALFSDYQFLANTVLKLRRKLALGGAPVYHYLFAWNAPALDGLIRAPHTAEIPFVLRTTDACAALTGTGARQAAMQDIVSSAWVAFARTGSPATAALPWPAYTAADPATMVLDDACHLVCDIHREELATLAAYPPYITGARPTAEFGTD